MAGSIGHCLAWTTGGQPVYQGSSLLENMGDMKEGVEEMMFVLGVLTGGYTSPTLKAAESYYYRCLRGEEPWPTTWFQDPRDV